MRKDEILHRLWTKAVGTSGYNRKEWQELERLVWDGIGASRKLKKVETENERLESSAVGNHEQWLPWIDFIEKNTQFEVAFLLGCTAPKYRALVLAWLGQNPMSRL